MKANAVIQAFNRGIISRLALARTDIERVALSAEEQTNWMPRALGSMMLRPGLQYITGTKSNNATLLIPFVFATDDTAIIEITNGVMRVMVDDVIVFRESVSSAVTNGAFTTDVSSWTDADDAGATSAWLTGGYMSLTGDGYNAAKRYQEITVAAGDQNVEHALRVYVTRGPVLLKVGTTAGDDSYIDATLGTGIHSLTLTPTGNFFIQFENYAKWAALVDSVTVESAGDMEIPIFISTAYLGLVRYDQSNDVVYLSTNGFVQYKLERRTSNSWSVVQYQTLDGPFRAYNQTTTSLTPSGLSGDITVTASRPFFKSGHNGAIFRIDSIGQTATSSLNGADQYTNDIRVTGIDTGRTFDIAITGTWAGTLTLQRSVGYSGAWVDVTTYTANTTTTYNDALDNEVIYYRIGFKTGDYTSGTADISMAFAGGSSTGIFQVTGFTSSTSVSARVIVDLGGTVASTAWAEGEWSLYRGWPTSVALYEGRLWWAGKAKIWGSVSGEYESFDDETVGDSGPIARTLTGRAMDDVHWLMPAQRLIMGTLGGEPSARSSSQDEPLTPTNFNAKDATTLGSAKVSPIKVDSSVFFVQRSKTKLYRMDYNIQINDYGAIDSMTLCPEVCEPEIVRIGVQRQPDTRIHCILSDGTVAILVFDPAENVSCWVKVETTGASGLVEDMVVLPGTTEDQVYYIVARTINGSTVRYYEKWALESECVGGTLNKQLDSFIAVSGSSYTAAHLAGETVRVWGDGIYQGEFTADGSGLVTFSNAITSGVMGLPYTADYKSTKLANFAQSGTALLQKKRVHKLGFILKDTHPLSLTYGPDFDNLDAMPLIEDMDTADTDVVWSDYDQEPFEFNGEWTSDARVCLRASAPFPCTALAMVIGQQTNDQT